MNTDTLNDRTVMAAVLDAPGANADENAAIATMKAAADNAPGAAPEITDEEIAAAIETVEAYLQRINAGNVGRRRFSRLRRVLRLLICTLKGGSSKSTTATCLAIACALLGFNVVLVCGDKTHRSATKWAQRAQARGFELPYEIVTWVESEHGKLSTFCSRIEREQGDDTVVIVDLGGGDAEAFAQGCLWADWLISPVAPVEMELDGVWPTYEAAAAVSEYKKTDLIHSVLLTRVPQVGKGVARKAREQLVTDQLDEETGLPTDPLMQWAVGAHVFETEVSRGLSYSDMAGHIPTTVGEYSGLLSEMIMILKALDEDGDN